MDVRGSGVGRLSTADVKGAFLVGFAVFVVAGAGAAAQWVAGQPFGPWGTLIVALLIFAGDCARRFMSDTTVVRVNKLSHNSRAGEIVAYQEGDNLKYGLLRQWQNGQAVVSDGVAQNHIAVYFQKKT